MLFRGSAVRTRPFLSVRFTGDSQTERMAILKKEHTELASKEIF